MAEAYDPFDTLPAVTASVGEEKASSRVTQAPAAQAPVATPQPAVQSTPAGYDPFAGLPPVSAAVGREDQSPPRQTEPPPVQPPSPIQRPPAQSMPAGTEVRYGQPGVVTPALPGRAPLAGQPAYGAPPVAPSQYGAPPPQAPPAPSPSAYSGSLGLDGRPMGGPPGPATQGVPTGPLAAPPLPPFPGNSPQYGYGAPPPQAPRYPAPGGPGPGPASFGGSQPYAPAPPIGAPPPAYGANSAVGTGPQYGAPGPLPMAFENTSGTGMGSVPPEIDACRWNWGSFWLTPIWAIVHNAWDYAGPWLGLFALRVFLRGFMAILGSFGIWGIAGRAGFNGHLISWRNRRYRDVDHYFAVQRVWAIAGWAWAAMLIIGVCVYVGFLFTAASKIRDDETNGSYSVGHHHSYDSGDSGSNVSPSSGDTGSAADDGSSDVGGSRVHMDTSGAGASGDAPVSDGGGFHPPDY